jgi:diguanylate cyclase (GGDEF)-like protein
MCSVFDRGVGTQRARPNSGPSVPAVRSSPAAPAPAAAERRQAGFAELGSYWFWEMAPDLRSTHVSAEVERLLGIGAADHIGKTWVDMSGGHLVPADVEATVARMERREPFELCHWRAGRDGAGRFVSTAGTPVFDAGGAFIGYRGVGRDLTVERIVKEELLETNRRLHAANRRVEARLVELRRANLLLAQRNAEMAKAHADSHHAALHDALTGLPNRRHLDEKFATAVEISKAGGAPLGALSVDLNRFKQINDALGHAAGDTVLRHVAFVLLRCVTPADFVARVGGDEFVVLCPGRDAAELGELARRLVAELERPLAIDGKECWCGASVGIAAMEGAASKLSELLVNADIALDRAKKQGRGSHEFFSGEIQRQVVRYKTTADGVLAGLKRGEFLPHYQPQISADSARIVGVEALARWHHPDMGVLPPDRFLRVAEDLGVVAALDRAIMEIAVSDLARWRRAGLTVPKLSVNVSARRLLERDLIQSVGELKLPQSGISFELLETVFLDEVNDTMAWNIDMLKEMGIEIELDDFGSGHASIISLVKLGPDAIKIDRQLISTITVDQKRRGLISSIIDMGRSLETRIIAEGVETGAQATLLHELGCDALQGFHFARPMCASEFESFLQDWQTQPAMGPLRRIG